MSLAGTSCRHARTRIHAVSMSWPAILCISPQPPHIQVDMRSAAVPVSSACPAAGPRPSSGCLVQARRSFTVYPCFLRRSPCTIKSAPSPQLKFQHTAPIQRAVLGV